MSERFHHDHATLEEFVRALARATRYKSHPLGFEDSLSDYWRAEAEDWVKELDDRLTPALSVSATRPSQDTIARMLAGYDDATWHKLREDRKRTYRRAADSLITQWSEFVALFES